MTINILPPDNYVKIWDKYSGHSLLNKEWLKNAIKLDVYTSVDPKLRALTNKLFDEISDKIKSRKSSRIKQTLKMVLINLWIGNEIDSPIQYSRNKNKYSCNRKYGKLFFRYNMLTQVIDALEQRGYIHQKIGFMNRKINKGKETKMWGTYKLRYNFTKYGLYTSVFKKPRPEEIIILTYRPKKPPKQKNKPKPKKIGYRETNQTKQWRDDLHRYNDFSKQHEVNVKLNGKITVDNRFLLNELYYNILKNKISIQTIILNKKIYQYYNYPLLQSYNNKYTNNNLHSNIQTSITNTFSSNRLLDKDLQHICGRSFLRFWFLPQLKLEVGKCKSQEERNAFLSIEHVLEVLGFDRVIFSLNYEYLHRVFSRRSFKKNGRAFGALHQNLPKHMRPYIHINGEKTTEIDYSGLHIRMLYHMEGIDYREDPYLICGGKDLRDTFKTVGLIAINAKNVRSAYKAIGDELEARGIPLPKIDEPLVWLVNTFRETHKPISKYLFSDIGITLMNKDSVIMNNILMRLMDKGILGLSVHDSVIVAEQYEDILREIMVAEYENVMKFKPMF